MNKNQTSTNTYTLWYEENRLAVPQGLRKGQTGEETIA